MQALLAKIFGVNWMTNIPAAGFAICSSVELGDFVPKAWEKYVLGFCAFAITAGLFAAKSANVTNSPVPSASKVFAPPDPPAVK